MSTSVRVVNGNSNQLSSFFCNNVNIPTSIVLKCYCCQNQQVQRHLEESQGRNYFRIPDRYVDTFVCSFCKKFSQPKCQYCWEAKPCCGHKQKVLYKDYYTTVKKDLLNNTTHLLKTLNKFDKPSSFNDYLSQQSSATFNKLILALNSIQQQLKKQIIQNMQSNNIKLKQIYKTFQDFIVNKVKSTTSGIDGKVKYVDLTQCQTLVKQVEEFRRQFENQAYELSQRYVERVEDSYGNILWGKIQQGFKQILTPNVTYKSSLTQTTQTFHTNNINSAIQSSSNLTIQNLQKRIKQLQQQLSQSNKKSTEKYDFSAYIQKRLQEFQQENFKVKNQMQELVQLFYGFVGKQRGQNMLKQKEEKWKRFDWVRKKEQILSLLKQQKNVSQPSEKNKSIGSQKQGSKQQIVPKGGSLSKLGRPRRVSETGSKRQGESSKQTMNSSWLQEVVNQIGQ